ncbi:TlpA family protein disulfide reductase [Ichthyenterobacterium magnum]|nr:TlpA disulfide reductase family protein [Ichthyenterobacterium magnum]
MLITLLVFFFSVSYSQISIVEVKAVYKSKTDGRIIPESEFQTYRGRHIFHKYIKGKNGAQDTIIITPPKVNLNKTNKETLLSLVGQSLKPFKVTDLYGNTYDSNKLKGKTIVMNFWFVACPPCIQEIPELNKLAESYNSNVVFIAFAKDTEVLLGKFLSKTRFEYNIIPNAGNISKLYNIYAYPTHIVIDKHGQISYTSVGLNKNSLEQLETEITNAL